MAFMVTNAPEAYDYGWATMPYGKSLRLFMFGKPVRLVEVDVDLMSFNYQRDRYLSGSYIAVPVHVVYVRSGHHDVTTADGEHVGTFWIS